jgi:putative cell wall-binding protein
MYSHTNYLRDNYTGTTLNTTRICGTNPIDASIETSRIVFTHMMPNAVILVNKDQIFDGIAAAPLVHFPYNASLLLTPGNMLYKETVDEISRLSPKGHMGIQIFLVGDISGNVEMQLNLMGYRTKHVSGRNHYETACQIPSYRHHFENVIIVSGEDFSEGIPAAFWSAHHGDPILFVKKYVIPSCTLQSLKKMDKVNVYILGSTETISKAVEETLSELPSVKYIDRIDGICPCEVSVNLSKYKNHHGDFGWGRDYRDGHAFSFGALNNAEQIISSVLFAHMGKHTPLLLIKEDSIPESVEKYIKDVKPESPKDMPKPPFMHGFILGCINQIAYPTQVDIEKLLSIDHEMMMDMYTDTVMEHMMDHK